MTLFFFSGFGIILHLVHHLASLSRSFCKCFAAKSIFLLTAMGRFHLQIVTC